MELEPTPIRFVEEHKWKTSLLRQNTAELADHRQFSVIYITEIANETVPLGVRNWLSSGSAVCLGANGRGIQGDASSNAG